MMPIEVTTPEPMMIWPSPDVICVITWELLKHYFHSGVGARVILIDVEDGEFAIWAL
jgi:hypothetical protein